MIRFIVKNKDNGKLLIDKQLDQFTVLYTLVNSKTNEVWIYVTEKPKQFEGY